MKLHFDADRLEVLKSCLVDAKISYMEMLPIFYSVVSESQNSVVLTNSNREIIYVNEAFESLSGYRLVEVLGKSPSILKSKKTPLTVYQELNHTLKKGEVWKGVFTNLHKNGDEYIEEAVITPIVSNEGLILFYFAEKKDITSLVSAESSVRKLTHFDSLTDLPNRNHFIEYASGLVSREHNNENYFTAIFCDLNRFKELNDNLGHQAGDVALVEVAKRIQKVIQPGDFAARLSGDEFVIIHKNTSEDGTRKLIHDLIAISHSTYTIERQEISLSMSIGSAKWPQDGKTLREVMSRADLAMYEAKSTGRDYFRYTEQVGSRFYRDITLSRKIASALDKQKMYLLYQPKLDLASGRMCGLEALLRWSDEDLGHVTPAEFIPIAEKHKLMNLVGGWVIQQACHQLKEWQGLGIDISGRLAINVSVQQIEHPDFFDSVCNTLDREGVSPSMIELEVTESVLMREPAKAMAVLTRLSDLGFSIAIDDFGTGFSSLAYLSQLNAKLLKIDKVFIDGVTTNFRDRMIVKSVIELSNNLGLKVIAEGVETSEQLKCLQEMGCHAIQGYYYSRPQMAEDICTFVTKKPTNRN
ncbi:hypothetical protein ViNHUV68_19710 [Vibrio sp. NH-UV-68]